MNPVVPRNILILTMVIVCFFPCSMGKTYPDPALKYEDKDDVSCGAGLDQVCCPVGKGAKDENIGTSNEATNKPGRAGCLCRCAENPIDKEGNKIPTVATDLIPAYCQVGQGGWVPTTAASGGAKKAAKKYKKL